ncbi:MAG: putative ribose-5-phosphate isomerase B [Alphaproteobacteria bacterium MarineAlpha5_Bin5]|nr:MAG: putative ribose-5-phosphate isomerase B [Alphaproteobacteria bacterium MarineAlpha5_Bin5]PPR52318.1 MAG: putative ribose-5-phosphate isomerase B [Alphaproteobacteria bacterium MarineAlpha5_Bin4]|tara:strand:+ start:1880 stop:2299 length:420 start_codon:yes stop_codon:yes gene_type:complete
MKRKIFIASDHAGYSLKSKLMDNFSNLLTDLGTDTEESVDYPDFAHELTSKINYTPNSLGILICGSGVGMSIAANRNKNIRAGLVHNSKIAKLIRQHNNANVLVLPGRFIDIQEAIKCVENFLNTEFESGRHKKRIDKI